MILDILTVLFFVLGFVLVLWMIGERRRDVLHGPYVTRALCGRDAGIGAFVAHFRAPSKISRLCSVCRQTFQAGSRPTGLRWARHRQLSRELRWRDYLQALTQWLQLKCGSVVTNRLHSLRAAYIRWRASASLRPAAVRLLNNPSSMISVIIGVTATVPRRPI
jgi:hypothetical protein